MMIPNPSKTCPETNSRTSRTSRTSRSPESCIPIYRKGRDKQDKPLVKLSDQRAIAARSLADSHSAGQSVSHLTLKPTGSNWRTSPVQRLRAALNGHRWASRAPGRALTGGWSVGMVPAARLPVARPGSDGGFCVSMPPGSPREIETKRETTQLLRQQEQFGCVFHVHLNTAMPVSALKVGEILSLRTKAFAWMRVGA
jgi:hypothetical protein